MTEVTFAAPSAFTTVGLPEQQRVELWESHNADALIGLRWPDGVVTRAVAAGVTGMGSA